MATGDGDGDGDRRVFVYGTLRPGRSNWRVVRPMCAHHEPATLPGYALYDLDHPGVVRTDEIGAAVAGDLLVLDGVVGDELDRLDAFEGYEAGAPDRSYYVRDRLEVVLGSGARVACWVYLPGARLRAQVREERRVPGGDWTG